MTFIAKFWRVTRYGVAASLAAVACFSALADGESGTFYPYGDCTWTWNGSNGWDVVCNFGGSGFIPVESGNVGSCTNCTAMSPELCASLKAGILYEVTTGLTRVNNLKQELNSTRGAISATISELQALKDDGDSFVTGVYSAFPSGTERREFIAGTTQYQNGYLYDQENGKYVTDNSVNMGFSDINTLYHYFNESVAPALDTSLNYLQSADYHAGESMQTLITIENSFNNISSAASLMNCEACEGSGGGGSSEPSQPSGGCPCSEAIYAVRDAVNNVEQRLTEINNHLSTWNNTIQKISSFVDYMKSAMSTLAYMGTNFVYATQYRKLNDTSFSMKQLHQDLWSNTNEFDFSSFGGLTWFSRVEYLLMNVAGIFDSFSPSSSDVNQVLEKTSQMEQETETKKTELDGYLDDLEEVSPTKVFSEKVKEILKLFKDAFGVNQRPDWSQFYMMEGNMESFGLDLNGTMRVRAFEGIDDLDSVNTFLDFIRRFCQVVYTCATIYLLWIVFVWVWGHFVSWMKIILPFYTSIFS